jgi:cob(I)alamin adenosyltransferase
MPLYTRTGDDGTTGTYGGGRIEKNSARIHAIGDIDELNAAIGVVQDVALLQLQSLLFDVGADLATPKENDQVRRIDMDDIAFLESWIDTADGQNEKLKVFILPGGCAASAQLHLARTVCRRAERSVITLTQQNGCSSEILVFINRLSDLLFALARLANKQAGVEDIPWTPRAKEQS